MSEIIPDSQEIIPVGPVGRPKRNREKKEKTLAEEQAEEAEAAAARPKRTAKRPAKTPAKTPAKGTKKLKGKAQPLFAYSTLSGEFYDISIPTYSNKFGEKYITCIWENGIDIPITKYIEELKDILKNKADDKSEKRKERLKFLLFCNEFKTLQEIFILFTNLLNGGGRNKEQTTLYETFPDPTSEVNLNERCKFIQYPEEQKLVLTSAGGNVMIIFAQFLHIILTTEKYSDIGEINKFILKHYDSSESKSGEPIFNAIKREIEDKEPVSFIIVQDGEGDTSEIDKENFKMMVNDIAKKSYSDFDFKITPNMNSLINEAYITEFNETTHDKDSEGFLLFRCKTAMDCMSNQKKEIDKDNTKIACDKAKKFNKDLLKKELKVDKVPDEYILLAPQTIQKNFFDEEWLKNHYILSKNLGQDQLIRLSKILVGFKSLFEESDTFENKFKRLKEEIASEIDKEEGNENFQNFLRCFSYLLTLYKKKLEIGIQTQINVNAILSNFGGIADLSSIDSVKIKYEIIIKYLYGISKTLNKYIELNIEKLKLDIDSINRSYLNIRTLLLKDGKPNDLPSFIGEVFDYLVTSDETFQNTNIIKKLAKCYIPEPCKYLRPANPRIYSYLSTKNKKPSPEEEEERDSLQKIYEMLHVNITNYDPPKIPHGLRLIINVIKQTSRQLTPINKTELDSLIEDNVFKDEEGNPIDLKLGDYTDEELFSGVPDDALEKYAAELGFECLTDHELEMRKSGVEEIDEIDDEINEADAGEEEDKRQEAEGDKMQEDEEIQKTDAGEEEDRMQEDGEIQEREGEEGKSPGKKQKIIGGKKTKKKLKKRKKTKRFMRKNKKTKKFKNKKKKLKKSKKHKKKLKIINNKSK